MKRLAYSVEKVTISSRREFLLAGGAMVTTLSLGRAHAMDSENVSEERKKIREIMNRYGSELGHARYIGQE